MVPRICRSTRKATAKKKIRLDLDRLAVETFATTQDDGAGHGTVRGHDSAPGSGIGCLTLGYGSESGYELCICEAEVVTGRDPACATVPPN